MPSCGAESRETYRCVPEGDNISKPRISILGRLAESGGVPEGRHKDRAKGEVFRSATGIKGATDLCLLSVRALPMASLAGLGTNDTATQR